MTFSLRTCVVLSVVLAITAGCNSPFSPKGNYEDRLVVYGVLTNRSDTQYVRVYSTYNPPGVDPAAQTSDNGLSGAGVVVTSGAGAFQFRENTTPRLDKSRYSDDIIAYASYPFPIEPGKTYGLSVTTKTSGAVTATVVMPKRARIQFLNAYILNGGGNEDENIVVFGWIRELTYGVMMQLHLFYDVLEGNSWVRHREEMPAVRLVFGDGSKAYNFPVLRRRVTSGLIRDKEESEMFVFSKNAYFEKVGEILTRYPAGTVHIKQALIVLTQVDKDLYAYSKRVNGFEDPYSIRTDLPDHTNISGGHGIFGAMVDDSAFVEITAW
ncbi:MAG: DUF4249 family protein [Ignavibacteriales bacterium]|nr:DUF4249 family protein [Ignavibacteriales bacterium]